MISCHSTARLGGNRRSTGRSNLHTEGTARAFRGVRDQADAPKHVFPPGEQSYAPQGSARWRAASRRDHRRGARHAGYSATAKDTLVEAKRVHACRSTLGRDGTRTRRLSAARGGHGAADEAWSRSRSSWSRAEHRSQADPDVHVLPAGQHLGDPPRRWSRLRVMPLPFVRRQAADLGQLIVVVRGARGPVSVVRRAQVRTVLFSMCLSGVRCTTRWTKIVRVEKGGVELARLHQLLDLRDLRDLAANACGREEGRDHVSAGTQTLGERLSSLELTAEELPL